MESFIQFMTEWGYLGLFLAAFLAGSVVPFSSEAVMVLLLGMGLSPIGCLATAIAGNTLGGMTCYWIGTLGKSEWITRLGVSERQLARARKFLSGRGAWMGFFSFLPMIGEAILVLLGLMRSNPWIAALSSFSGKAVRYTAVLLAFKGLISFF